MFRMITGCLSALPVRVTGRRISKGEFYVVLFAFGYITLFMFGAGTNQVCLIFSKLYLLYF